MHRSRKAASRKLDREFKSPPLRQNWTNFKYLSDKIRRILTNDTCGLTWTVRIRSRCSFALCLFRIRSMASFEPVMTLKRVCPRHKMRLCFMRAQKPVNYADRLPYREKSAQSSAPSLKSLYTSFEFTFATPFSNITIPPTTFFCSLM